MSTLAPLPTTSNVISSSRTAIAAVAALAAIAVGPAACGDSGETTPAPAPSSGLPDAGPAADAAGTGAASASALAAFNKLPVVPAKITRVDVPAPEERTGGTGSALAYDARDNLYWMVTDTPPAGADDWPLYLYRVRVEGGRVENQKAIPITQDGKHLQGSDLDPEGIALAPDGTLWLCDEKGPFIVNVSREGKIQKKVEPPALLKERQANRGLEGIAITADGKMVFAILQNGVESEKDKLNTVIAAYDVASGTFQLHGYRLEDDKTFDYPKDLMVAPRTGAHDLHLVEGRTLLVLERDNQSGENARMKRIFRVDVPETPSTTPLAKTLVLDLKGHGYTFEQPEGLTMRGPRTLAVSNDNDALADVPAQIWEIDL